MRVPVALSALALAAACRSGPAAGPAPVTARADSAAVPVPTPGPVADTTAPVTPPVPDTAAVRPPAARPDSGAARPDTAGIGAPVTTPDSGAARPTATAPPSQRCQFVIENVDRQGVRIEVMPGVVNYFAGGNVRLRCANIAVRITSDSVASYQGNVVQFVGGVRYRDSTIEMTSDFGTYFRGLEKWEARGHVVLRNILEGTVLEGPMLDYYRPVRSVRDSSEMYADQRPTITLPVQDSTGRSADPYVVVGDRVRTRGESLIWSGGRVTIDRTDLRGRGDSLFLDQGQAGIGSLIGRASINRVAADSFQLTGQRIDLALDGRELTYVTARDSAVLVGQSLTLNGDAIGLDVNNREVEQTVAWGRTVRPVALADAYEVRGDSLAFDTPNRKLKEVRAFRGGWVGARPDSSGDRDWVAGDSVTASFLIRDSAPAARPTLEKLEARGQAKALYRFVQAGQPKPSISYTKADRIVVTMKVIGDSTTVDNVFALGNVEGVHLQPGIVRPDSLRADSLRVRRDTTLAGRPR